MTFESPVSVVSRLETRLEWFKQTVGSEVGFEFSGFYMFHCFRKKDESGDGPEAVNNVMAEFRFFWLRMW